MTSLVVPTPVWPGFWLPYGATPALTTISTINNTGEYVDMIGQVWWDGSPASKDISSAGGAVIVRFGAVTFANAGTTVSIGIQDPDTATGPPARGDGTFDVLAQLVGVTDTITANTVRETAMESGSKTITNGQIVVVRVLMDALGGADSVIVQGANSAFQQAIPSCTANTGVVAAVNANPMVILKADDGTLGTILGSPFVDAVTARTFDSGTGTADEFGNTVQWPIEVQVHGLIWRGAIAGGVGNCEFLLYSDPAGTPVAERTTTIDTTLVSSTTQRGDIPVMFASPYTVPANTKICLAIRPAAADADVVMYDLDFGAETEVVEFYASFGGTWAKATRLNNSGAFTEDAGAVMILGALVTDITVSGGGDTFQVASYTAQVYPNRSMMPSGSRF